EEAAKCALISMDSTLKSNLSVGMPLDLLCYPGGSYSGDRRLRIEADNPYFKSLRGAWGERIKHAFRELPGLDWEQCAAK
ncbi:MAG: peptidase, partial [Gammaproteobacteria bacterium]|nr:peptidase [Gammaproteobacteria bacterium]